MNKKKRSNNKIQKKNISTITFCRFAHKRVNIKMLAFDLRYQTNIKRWWSPLNQLLDPGFNTSKVTIELNIHKGLTSLSQNVYHNNNNKNAANKKNDGHFWPIRRSARVLLWQIIYSHTEWPNDWMNQKNKIYTSVHIVNLMIVIRTFTSICKHHKIIRL